MLRDPLWLAFAVPALAAAWALLAWAAARRRAVAAALGRAATLSRVAGDAAARRRLAGGLRLSALALLFLALAGPQWGVELVKTSASARQVVVAVDVSLSMRTPDVKPSRLERAKASLSLLLDQLRGARVGVVAFAGDAQVVCPLTSDIAAAKELLGALDVGAVPVPGTAIGAALRVAGQMLGKYPGASSVVLLTDGEDHHSDPVGAARELAAQGVHVYTIGIGTAEGEPIPLNGGGYKKDAHGATVVSRLGEDALSQIAKLTGGAYYRTSAGEDEVADIASRLNASQSAHGLGGTATRWQDRYRWPLALAFVLLLAELLLPLLAEPRPAPASGTRAAAQARAAAGTSAAVLLAALALAAPARAGMLSSPLRDANKKYDQGQYDDALALDSRASEDAPNDPRPVFNAGDALYRLDRDSDAAGAFASVASRRDAQAPLRAAALYNLGNSRYQAEDYPGAADAYRRALTIAPDDADARRNLVLAVLRSRNPPPKKKPQDKKQKPKPDPKPKPKPNQDKDKSGGGGQKPPPTSPRPQDQMSREDADRVMRAVSEREKAVQKQAPPPTARYGNRPPPKTTSEEDW
ncbi:MAG: VWA domain-containing protein [Elusimicrobia bacterium]|nr:VWA domain-containing protein [Elusimicrobiota bacterium]